MNKLLRKFMSELFGKDLLTKESNESLWTLLLNKYGVLMPFLRAEEVNKIYFVNLKTEIKNLTFNGFMMKFKEPIYPIKGYRLVPGLPSVAVSEFGEVFNIKTKNFLSHRLGSDLYLCTGVYVPQRKKFREFKIHRLVALAWLENPNPISAWQVNHKDGIKTNPVKNNLEWVTPKDNNFHAIENGLTDKNYSVRVFDIKTQIEHSFYSLTQASLFMGLTKEAALDKFILPYPESLILKRYEVRLTNDDRPWYYKGNTEYEVPKRFFIDVFKQDILVNRYKGTFQFMKDWQLQCEKIEVMVSKAKAKNPDYHFVLIDRKPKLPIQARNIITGQVFETIELNPLSRLTQVPDGVIDRYLRLKTSTCYNNWQFRVKTSDPWDEPKEKRKNQPVQVFNLNTKTTEYFESLTQCSKKFNIVDLRTITHRLDTGKDYKGLVFSSKKTI